MGPFDVETQMLQLAGRQQDLLISFTLTLTLTCVATFPHVLRPEVLRLPGECGMRPLGDCGMSVCLHEVKQLEIARRPLLE